jgi:hypothetical protein
LTIARISRQCELWCGFIDGRLLATECVGSGCEVQPSYEGKTTREENTQNSATGEHNQI